MRATAKMAWERLLDPSSSGATAQKPPEEISKLLRHPTTKMLEGEMKPVDISDDDLKALVAYIKSLK